MNILQKPTDSRYAARSSTILLASGGWTPSGYSPIRIACLDFVMQTPSDCLRVRISPSATAGRQQRLGSYAFLSVEGVVLLAQVHVLLVAELDASSLETCRVIALECCGDGVLLLLRDLHAQLFSVSERPQYTIVSLTARSDDVAHTPPCCPRMAALLSLPVPTMLESTYAVGKR